MRIRTVGLIVILAIGVVAAPLTSNAQKPDKVYRIGWLGPYYGAAPYFGTPFLEEFRELGWIEGENFVVEHRSAGREFERLPDLAAELVRLKVDVIVAEHTMDTHAAKNATSTIPIVFTLPSDPVGDGFIESHARPGKNLTGIFANYMEIQGRTMQVLTEAVPGASRIAYLYNPAHGRITRRYHEDAQASAKTLGVTLQVLEVRDPKDFEPAFSAMNKEHADAVFVLPEPLVNAHKEQIAGLAIAHRLPMATIGGTSFATAGAFIVYTPDIIRMYRRAAHFVDKVLKGANPAVLPVEKPTHYHFVINLKTANALGLTIPQSLFVQATELIEKSILVIGDFGDNRSILYNPLRRAGYGMLIRSVTWENAVTNAELHRPDLILMDIHFLGLAGYETLRRIKAKPALSHIPVIAITDDKARASEVGCDGYMLKPNLLKTAEKMLKLLRQAVPGVSRVGFLWNPAHGEMARRYFEEMQSATRTLGITFQSVEVKDAEDFEPAFSTMSKERCQALVVLSGPMTNAHAPRIAELAIRNELPMMSIGGCQWPQGGSLMSYGVLYPPLLERAAKHVDKILKGSEPVNLAVEEPTPFEFVVNLKTAKELGVTIPQSVVSQANKVIK